MLTIVFISRFVMLYLKKKQNTLQHGTLAPAMLTIKH